MTFQKRSALECQEFFPNEWLTVQSDGSKLERKDSKEWTKERDQCRRLI